MPRIDLSITADYLPDWGLAEGIRELVQNARDAEVQFGARMSVRHDKGTRLIIENEGVVLPHEALLFGTTSKIGRDDLIGRFGEGLKLGILALVRANHEVKIRSGSEVWEPEIVHSDKFRARILSVDIRGGNEPRNRVRIEVGGVSPDRWEALKPSFLFLQKVPAKTRVETSAGALLLHHEQAGHLYVKGILVAHRANIRYGYDFAHARVDRDRRMIEDHDIKTETSRIWRGAMEQRPELETAAYVLMQQDTFVDAVDVGWHLSDEQRKSMAARFEAQFGAAAMPVESEGEARELEHLGRRGIVTARPLRDALRFVFGTVDRVKQDLAKEVVRTWSREDLDAPARRNLELAVERIKGVTAMRDDLLDVVDFRSRTLAGLYDGGSRRIKIARSVLADEAQTLATVVHELAHDLSAATDGAKGHVQAIEDLWTGIYRGLVAA
jgi:hypothetical protein